MAADAIGPEAGRRARGARGAFTLIELLVVVAIIALLISILLPSLSRARDSAKAVKCAANLRQVGQAVAGYLAENKTTYPAAYQYLDEFGSIVFQATPPAGYSHWSYSLYQGGKVQDEAFQCPSMERQGHPRTNPGGSGKDWNIGEQIDDGGQIGPNPITDRQAPRISYTANAAILPRNKWTVEMSAGARTNRYVRETELKGTAEIILAADFNKSFKAVGEQQGSNILSKSHRPVNPFYHNSAGYNEYAASPSVGFRYTPIGDATYGLKSQAQIEEASNLIGGSLGTELNAIGRHHPGEDKLGGSANFLFCDGHLERTTVLRTMELRRWGERYYSLSGETIVNDRYGELP